ncbi:Uncharacterized protein dnm_046720 [Desulfonema magnum]|uniref:Uncharacterized protein n=1 Tax=Desulfonema magnum TaxID=45655 RepID=A0A975BNC2_9BACT|nr:Uncharacterized protein dnm_046720 [Desulfonema magnum]
MENLSVTGFREPEIQDICFPGNRRFPGMSVRLPVKTEGRAQPPEIGASPESVIIRIFFTVPYFLTNWVFAGGHLFRILPPPIRSLRKNMTTDFRVRPNDSTNSDTMKTGCKIC